MAGLAWSGILRTDDPTDELGAAWGIKEQLRRLLKTSALTDEHEATMRLGHYVLVANTPETDRLWQTVNTWWNEIRVLIVTGVINARTGRGFRNEHHYLTRKLLTSAAKRRA